MSGFGELSGMSHREAAGRLLADGWNVCGVGDWATVWRSPDGAQVARVSPFEPAYQVFVQLCRALEGHPMLPRVDFDSALAGGGRLTVMEFLLTAEQGDAEGTKERWADAVPDDPISVVRREAERLNNEASQAIPFWGGLDLNPGNVMKSLSAELKLVDLFYAAGLEIYRVLLEDPATVAARFPADQREYICEIAAVVRMSTPEETAALRRAAASIA